MGRMSKIGPDGLTEPGAESGRSHWTQAGFALVIGGGLKMGQVIGATEPLARYPTTPPYTPQNVLATLYHVLGIDPETTTMSGERPILPATRSTRSRVEVKKRAARGRGPSSRRVWAAP
jgi:hypothetical protein